MKRHFIVLAIFVLFGSTVATVSAQATPTLKISASKTSVAFGESSTVSWTSTGMAYCTVHANGAASSNWSGTSGSFTASGYDVDTYTQKCLGNDGRQYTSSVTITGKILKISASPSTVLYNGTSTVSWDSYPAYMSRCTVHVDGAASSNWSGLRGSFTAKFTANGFYDLKCLRKDGRWIQETARIEVLPATPPPPPPPPPATSTPPQSTSTPPSTSGPLNSAYWDVKVDCGAKGDGTIDDAPAIQSCLDKAASSTVKIVQIPAGTYHVSRQKHIWDDTYDSRGTTCPYDDKPVAGYALYIPGNITIIGAGSAQTILTLNNSASTTRIANTYIMHAGSYLTDANGTNVGIYTPAALADCKARGMTTDPTERHGYIADWQNHATNITISDVGFRGQTIAENAAISIYYGYKLRLSNIATKDFYRGIKIARTADVVVENSLFEDNAYYAMMVSAPHFHGRNISVPNPSAVVRNNTIRNSNEFFARNVAKDGTLLQQAGFFAWVGVYLNGSGVDFLNNTIVGGSLNLENISNTTISGNKIVGAPIGIRVGYFGGGAGAKVKVLNNTIYRVATGITVVGHNEGTDILTVEGNSLSLFTYLTSYEGGALGVGRSFAGINVEDSKNVSVLKNTITDLDGTYHSAGIRIANSDLNHTGDYVTAQTPLDGIYLADNTIKFKTLAGSVGVYAENYKQLAWQRNQVTANETLRVINGGAPVLENPVWCRGPSSACPRRVESDDLYYKTKTAGYSCVATASYCDLTPQKQASAQKFNLASAFSAFATVLMGVFGHDLSETEGQ